MTPRLVTETWSGVTADAAPPMMKLVPAAPPTVSRPLIVRSFPLEFRSIPPPRLRLRIELALPMLTVLAVLKMTSSAAVGSPFGVQLVLPERSTQSTLPPIHVRTAAPASGAAAPIAASTGSEASRREL
jgi:hypothetical protein